MEAVVLILVLLVAVLALGWWVFGRKIRRGGAADDIRTRINLMIAVPRGKEDPSRELKTIIAPMETVMRGLANVDQVIGHRHLTFEIATDAEAIVFYVTVPKELVGFVEKQITSQYPDATVEVAPYPNIFPENGRVVGAQLKLKREDYLPIKTFEDLPTDGLNALTNTLSKLASTGAGAAIQILFRPTTDAKWQDRARALASRMQQGEFASGSLGKEVVKGILDLASTKDKSERAEPKRLTGLQEEVVSAVEKKAARPGFDVVIRVVAAAADEAAARQHLQPMVDSFLQFGSHEINQIVLDKRLSEEEIVKNYVLRQFGPAAHSSLLNTAEIATLFHLPHEAIETPNIKWLKAKRLPAPDNLSKEGIILGKNVYRGVERLVKIQPDDRRRHIYMIGKTGTGKTTWMQNMVLQDIINGEGVCVVDPHGDMSEWILQRIPKDRVDDVIHFYPPDTERPLGLNMLEANTPTEKDMVVAEMISIFYKLFDPQGTGNFIGPIFEHYMRNILLLLLADESQGATLIDIPRVLTDPAFREAKLLRATDPTVLRFWKEEFEQARKSNQHGEMLSYIISKIGRFISNQTMRNIVGQSKSAFDIRDVMDNRKVLIVNLSKGLMGDINSNLLGFAIVSKLQMAALARADQPEAERKDFYLYIDEFQNVTTDSIVTILSEARKYKLNLIIAHQFIAQLEDKIRDAVLGNVGSMVAFRIGPQDTEWIGKEYEPDVTANDLINIENRNAYVKLMIDGGASRPFTMQTLPPMGRENPRISQAVRQLSRLKFGRDKRVVDLEVGERIKFTKDLPPSRGDLSNPPQGL
ncbi:MAG: type IV secretion system DNA-binding domain-containing protein [bacterium]